MHKLSSTFVVGSGQVALALLARIFCVCCAHSARFCDLSDQSRGDFGRDVTRKKIVTDREQCAGLRGVLGARCG